MNDAAPTPAEMLARARALAPILAARAEACERARRVPDATIDDFRAASLHRMLQPARFGGFEMGWDVLCEAALEFGQGCAAQGWVLNVYGDHAQWLGMYPAEAQDEVWGADPHALLSTCYVPRGRAVRKGGGIVVSGRWSFASGIDHASWLLAGAMLEEGGAPRHVIVLIPKSAVTVIDDWHVAGLAGTGSKSFAVEDYVTPAHRFIYEQDFADGTAPGSLAPGAASLYRYPRRAASVNLAAVPVGAAIGMLDEFAALCADKARRGRRAAAEPATALAIAETAAELDCARWLVVETARRNMEVLSRGESPSLEMRAVNRRNQGYAAELARRAAGRIFGAAGGNSAYLSSPLQRAFRDIHAASAHFGLYWDIMGSHDGLARLGHALDRAEV